MEQVTDHILAAARKVIAVHINYPSRAAQRGRTPEQPSYFLKPSSSLALGSASSSTVERPAGCELLGYEGEIALIIGKPARRVGIEDAWSHVEWVTASNDLGVYDLRYADKGSNLRSKGGDGFTPVGPGLIAGGRRRPRQTAHPHLAQRRAGPGRHHRGPALPVRPARGGPVPAAHPRRGRHHPHRHPRRRLGGQAGRRRRGGSQHAPTAALDHRPPGHPVEEGTTPFADFGARPKTDDLQREEAYGSREAAGLAAAAAGRRSCPRS